MPRSGHPRPAWPCRHRDAADAAKAAPVPAARNPGILLGMLVLYVVWGSTYLGIAVAVQTIPPFLMAATRFVLAGVILLGLVADRAAAATSSGRPAASGATR